MDGMRFVFHLHGHGTLSADMVAHYKMPCDATLVQVDAVATTAAVGSVIIGTDADDNGYSDDVQFRRVERAGDCGSGRLRRQALNADTAECPHIAKGTVLLITVTHASMINPDLALTFLEG